MYRFKVGLGFPFWKTFARLGCPIELKIEVFHDAEADVYVARGANFQGLVVEAATLDELKAAVSDLLPDILNNNYPLMPRNSERLATMTMSEPVAA